MPPKPNKDLRVNGNGTYKNSNRKSYEYQKTNYEVIKFSVPKGVRDVVRDYVDSSDRYDSVNEMLSRLVALEISGNKTLNIRDLIPKDTADTDEP